MKNGLKLERAIYRSWRTRYAAGRTSKYEVEARKGYAKEARRADEDRILHLAKQTQVLLIGDDRLVPQDQEEIRSLLKKGRLLQEAAAFITDRFSNRPEKPEGGCLSLLEFVRKNRLPLVLMGGNRSLPEADRAIVKRTLSTLRKGKRAIIWTGSLRLSPSKLPALFMKYGIVPFSISLQTPEVRWRHSISRGWMIVQPSVACYVERSPLLTLELRRIWNSHGGSFLQPEKLESEFYQVAKEIIRRAGQKISLKKIRLIHPFDVNHLNDIANGRAGKPFGSFLKTRLIRGESAYLPSIRTVLLSTLDRGHLAEEVGHCVRSLGAPDTPSGPYKTAVEEAFAFMASRWIDRSRPEPGFDQSEGTLWETVHRMGYRLGARLSDRWFESRKARSKIADLWRVLPRKEKEAQRLWKSMVEMT